MTDRYLVMGDNHGDTESLRRVREDVEDETFDFVVHVGDFTKAWRTARQTGDERAGKELGAEQLATVEPLLAAFDDLAEHGLLWVYGNQDYFGDLAYDLDVGTEVPDDGTVTVGDQRFTSSLDAVESDVVLVTHMEYWRLLDSFEGKAHFCGNTHRGRQKDRRLNSSFLQVTDPETGTKNYGGYFVVELDDGHDPAMDVEMRPIGDLERVECDRHAERGVQFQPPARGCMFCRERAILLRDLSASAFYGLTADSDRESVTTDELVDYALGLWRDPPSGFADDFEEYLTTVEDDRYAPLARGDDGRLTVAEESYAY